MNYLELGAYFKNEHLYLGWLAIDIWYIYIYIYIYIYMNFSIYELLDSCILLILLLI